MTIKQVVAVYLLTRVKAPFQLPTFFSITSQDATMLFPGWLLF